MAKEYVPKNQQKPLFSDNPEFPVLSLEGVNDSIAGFNITKLLRWPNYLVSFRTLFILIDYL